MAHNLEIIDGVAQHCYSGDTPWHGLGKKIPHDLTPEQICKEAGLDWSVERRPAFATLNGKRVACGSGILVRVPNGKNVKEESLLTRLPHVDNWHPLQNEEAFSFFNEFVALGDMEMNTAGSLANGEIVWALAKVKESFTVVGKKDEIESYLLLTNPHRFGKAIDVRFTPTRVVCNNTLSLALSESGYAKVASSHRNPFNAEDVKEKLGLAHYKLDQYKERAQFLSKKRYTKETLVEYFKRVFPLPERDKDKEYKRGAKELSRGAQYSMAVMDTQPGAEFGQGTWWQAYTGSSFYLNHLAGKNQNNRVESLWYGASAKTNVDALNIAVEMANAA